MICKSSLFYNWIRHKDDIFNVKTAKHCFKHSIFLNFKPAKGCDGGMFTTVTSPFNNTQ